MYVTLKLTEVEVPADVFGNFWLNAMFVGHLPSDPQVRVLASTFVRLAQSAIRGYNLGIACTREYWGTRDKIALGAMQQATSHFESCVSDMHRAIKFYTRLRRHPNLGTLSGINDHRAKFATSPVHDQIRNARNEIHHMEELVLKGEIVAGKSPAIRADGPEIDHPSGAGQTIKTIDRLSVGNCELLAQDVADWLTEMVVLCERMSTNDGQRREVVA